MLECVIQHADKHHRLIRIIRLSESITECQCDSRLLVTTQVVLKHVAMSFRKFPVTSVVWPSVRRCLLIIRICSDSAVTLRDVRAISLPVPVSPESTVTIKTNHMT